MQSFFNEKWVPGTEPELRTRLKKATKENHVATGGKAQQALKHEIAAMEQALTHTGDSHSHGQQQQQQRGVGGDAYGAAGGAAGAGGPDYQHGGERIPALEQRLGSGAARSEDREALANMVAKAAAPSHVATKSDKQHMNQADLDDLLG